MKKLIPFLIFGILTLSIISCKSYKVNSTNEKENYVLLISFDGFRHDYTQKYQLPNFLKMQKQGSYAKAMLPVFPSKTFPNHYSIITGMYAENHKLVDNKFYDRDRKNYYSIADRKTVEDPYYYGGIPLWQHLQRYGIKTASCFWVGSESPIMGEYPTYHLKYDSNMPNEKRISQVMQWFNLPKEKRPRFVTLYFSLVDTKGHQFGPNSKELEKAVNEADRLMGIILDDLKKIPLPITTIVVSDHGMIEMPVGNDNLIFLDTFLKPIEDQIIYVNNGMHCHIYLKEEKNKEYIYSYLEKTLKNQAAKVYKKEDTPKRWHYNKSSRIGDILLVTEAPAYMLPNKSHAVTQKKRPWGTHGYDPYTTPDMGAIFYVIGPYIKKNYEIEVFENVNVYPFIDKILGVPDPKEIDGNSKVLEPIILK